MRLYLLSDDDLSTHALPDSALPAPGRAACCGAAAPGLADRQMLLLCDTAPEHAAIVLARVREAVASLGAMPPPARGRAPAAPATSPAMHAVQRLVERVARSDLSVLVLGETGVGKERIAEALHRGSPRKSRPLLRLNCAALGESLLESELFGHERGAFTGAQERKRGLLESAEGGTVFLDEVGDMPLPTQVKLLRVLEERKVRRVGGLESIAIDVRFVAATNRDLEREIARGAFRQDLFFRLNGVSVVVPPLRERAEEIPGLARAFSEEACARLGRPRVDCSPAAAALLLAYPWPGNVRELRSTIERAIVLCDGGTLEPSHLPEAEMRARSARRDAPQLAPPKAVPASLRTRLAPLDREELLSSERQRIVEALAACAGNQTEAAGLLGISRRTLINRIAEYGLPRPRKLAEGG